MKNSQEPNQNKTVYYATMIVSMLLGVALVLGTPLFNGFVPQQKNSLPISGGLESPAGIAVDMTGGSSY